MYRLHRDGRRLHASEDVSYGASVPCVWVLLVLQCVVKLHRRPGRQDVSWSTDARHTRAGHLTAVVLVHEAVVILTCVVGTARHREGREDIAVKRVLINTNRSLSSLRRNAELMMHLAGTWRHWCQRVSGSDGLLLHIHLWTIVLKYYRKAACVWVELAVESASADRSASACRCASRSCTSIMTVHVVYSCIRV